MSESGAETPSERLRQLLFIVAVFAAAFLIFLVQPLVAKRILPWFGGSAGVWMICLAFYQTALFAGYAYAHGLIRFAGPTLQLCVHGAVLALAIFSLPVLPEDVWKPTGPSPPSLHIASLLAWNVAIPFAALAATGPLVQVWFARTYPKSSPYPLYAVSNIGSLLALVAYPFWIEPNFALSATGTAWCIAFAGTALAVLGCAAIARRPSPEVEKSPSGGSPGGPGRVLLWILLPGTAVILLMGVSNRITLDVASVPFLWILPLATYLATFILSFASDRFYLRDLNLLIAVLSGVAILRNPETSGGIELLITLYCSLLFSTCMLMHGELHRLRPTTESLTAFYLCISGGGALGGLFVGLAAPQIFDDYHELSFGIAAAWILFLIVCLTNPESWFYRGRPKWIHVTTAVATVVAAGAFISAPDLIAEDRKILQERTFFGVLRVYETGEGRSLQRHLMHGSTLHGMQLRSKGLRSTPTTYFGGATPIGILLKKRAAGSDTRVGIVGLGVGTLASYGRVGDLFRFYEIDPAVVRIAQDPAVFDFLARSRATIEVVEGDGRLALERERTTEGAAVFDILVVDAFSSDAIPVHLLTRESFQIYRESLTVDGILAIHVSNRHFDLAPIAAYLGRSVGLANVRVQTQWETKRLSTNSTWIFLSQQEERIEALLSEIDLDRRRTNQPDTAVNTKRLDAASLEGTPEWTDDFSDLFGALRE